MSWLALIVTGFYSLLGSCRSEECGHERLVKCGRPLERINTSSFVETKEELQRVCPDFEAGMKCIQTYTLDCLQEKQREHFNSLYLSTYKVVMELCQDGPYQDEFLRHTRCMKTVQPEYELCSKRYQKTTQELEQRNQTSPQETMKPLCCGFKGFLECAHHTIRRACGEETAQFGKEFLDRMSSSLLRSHCAPFTNEVCAIGNGGSRPLALARFPLFPLALPTLALVIARYFT